MFFLLQHDIPECLLRGTLNGVVEDCVSFVGVDLNVAGVSMLRCVITRHRFTLRAAFYTALSSGLKKC